MRHPILNTIPGTGEANAFYIDHEIDAFSNKLRSERAAVRTSRLKDKKPQAVPARPRAAMSAKEKAQAAHDQFVKAFGSAYCHHH
jgi:hypothetical protein